MTRPAAPVRTVGYLVNQYPKVSHTFIRREIRALEQLGWTVHRHALRGWDAPTPDATDAAEQRQTSYLLRGGIAGLLAPTVRTAVSAPVRFTRALRMAWQLSRHAARGYAYHLVYLAEACALLGRLRAQSVQHLHTHFGTNGATVALLLHTLGGPCYSFTVHGPEEFDAPEALHLGDKVVHAAFTVAISSYGRSQLLRWTPIAHWPQIEVVRCGVDPSFLEAPLALPPDTPRLVCVGRLSEQKGQLLLLDAVAALAARGRTMELVLAGDGELRPDIEARIDQHGLTGRVRITGWISGDAVRTEIEAARALVLASFAEGLPVVVMEALARGRPVIATSIAGMPELVQHGVNGWLLPAGDVTALADAMAECLDTPPARLAEMGRQGAGRVRERHDAAREAARLAALFEAAATASAETVR